MKSVIEIHNSLLADTGKHIKRELSEKIDWSHRLIAIKGARAVGKTAFLLDYARKSCVDDKTCLYVNMNNLFFTQRGLVDFIDEFYKKGGRLLLLDQIHKYPNWDNDLKYCYENYPELKIVFTISSILRVKSNEAICNYVAVYRLSGLSFREFLNNETGNSFKSYTLEELLKNHEEIAKEVVAKVQPLAYFNDYLRYGCYPGYGKGKDSNDFLLKIVNLMLEFDITYLNQIELKYLPKLKQLLYIIASQMPFQPNISKLATAMSTSRATVMNYLKYLENARLIHSLTKQSDTSVKKKPSKIYLHNTNLLYAISPDNVTDCNLHKTFFCNQVSEANNIFDGEKDSFIIGDNTFKIINSEHDIKDAHLYYVTDKIEIGTKNRIPLWLFGFLY